VVDFPAPFRGGDFLPARPAIVQAIRGRCFGLGIEMGIVGVFYDSARSQRAARGSLVFYMTALCAVLSEESERATLLCRGNSKKAQPYFRHLNFW
jgi:hypothetical protein